MDSCEIHVLQRMNTTDFDDLLTFPLLTVVLGKDEWLFGKDIDGSQRLNHINVSNSLTSHLMVPVCLYIYVDGLA